MTGTAKSSFKRTLIRNTRILGVATSAWVLSMAVATFGPGNLWHYQGMSLAMILLNMGFGVGMILANVRHLKALDELQQRIQLIGMGISLGVAVVFGLSLSILEDTGLIGFQMDISFLVILIGLTYLVSVLIATKRYQ